MKQLQFWLVFQLLLVGWCDAQTPRLVKDINRRSTPNPSNPRPGSEVEQRRGETFVTVLGVTYFVASHPNSGTELYRTSGSAATTRIAKDIWRGPGSSNPRHLTSDGWRLFFSADDSRNGRELWIAEPLSGTVRRVKDINPALASSSNPAHFLHYNGVILFQATDFGGDVELWRTDGSEKNTYRVADLAPGILKGSSPKNFTIFKGQFYFQASDGTAPRLWRTDGTAKGTVKLGVDVDFARGDMVEFRGDLYFAGRTATTGIELWKIDGSTMQPKLVHDVSPGSRSSAPEHMTVFRNELYFAGDGPSGVELWKTDGTTVTLFDVYNGIQGSQPHSLVVHGVGLRETLFFVARGTLPGSRTKTGEELWSIDGNGLRALDLVPGGAGSNPHGMVAGPGGYLYFSAWSFAHSHELWRSDGTLAGTRLFKQINSYGSLLGSDPSFLTPHASAGLLFACDDGPHGVELWECDGTVSGTRLLADINAKPNTTIGSRPVLKAAVGGSVYFTADAGSTGGIVWSTNGTAAGTYPVIALQKASVRNVGEVLAIGNRAFIVGDGRDPNGQEVGSELWVIDQRTGGIVMLDLLRGRPGSQPRSLYEYRGVLYFSAVGDLNQTGPAQGRELWRSDGTVAGTRMLTDINPGSLGSGPLSSNPDQFFVFRNRLYFAARDQAHGLELWRTDGTAAKTEMVIDILRGPEDSHPHGFARLRDRMVFVATGTGIGTELFVSDGTRPGTQWIDLRAGTGSGFSQWHAKPRRVLTVANDLVYFAADGDLNYSGSAIGMELWCSDGTPMGTQLVADIWPGPMGSEPSLIVRAGDSDRVVFVARLGTQSRFDVPALHVSDGTLNGTSLLRRLNKGWTGLRTSDSGRFGARNSYFRLPIYLSQSQTVGFEVYLTDGTAARTRMIVSDFNTSVGVSPEPGVLISNSGRLFVTRDDPTYGSEVFVTDDHAASVPLGPGCSRNPDAPTLTSGDPIIGMPLRTEVRGSTKTPGVLMVGMWRASPYQWGPACRFHVDISGPQAFVWFATDATGSWRGTLRTTGAYVGFSYAIQACLNDYLLTGTVSFTNGVVLTAGTR